MAADYANNTKALALRPRDAARMLGICQRTLWELSAPRGPIPCVRIGRGKRHTVLYPVAELEAWLRRESRIGANREGPADE